MVLSIPAVAALPHSNAQRGILLLLAVWRSASHTPKYLLSRSAFRYRMQHAPLSQKLQKPSTPATSLQMTVRSSAQVPGPCSAAPESHCLSWGRELLPPWAQHAQAAMP